MAFIFFLVDPLSPGSTLALFPSLLVLERFSGDLAHDSTWS